MRGVTFIGCDLLRIMKGLLIELHPAHYRVLTTYQNEVGVSRLGVLSYPSELSEKAIIWRSLLSIPAERKIAPMTVFQQAKLFL
jgi:hypothetical protein